MAVQVRTGKACRGLSRSGWVGCGMAVAARMFWVGLDVVRQEMCRGLDGQ
jgi:hypothetical protein